MAEIGRYIYNTLSAALFGISMDGIYQPTVSDVIAVKNALHKKSALPYELVDSIVDMAEYWPHTTTSMPQITTVRAGDDHENIFILRSYPLGYLPSNPDLNEEYQMPIISLQTYETLQPKPWPEARQLPDEATNEVLLQWSSKSLPKGQHPCRKIVFTIKSHDQGWGGTAIQRGTYNASYTWFDVGLERMTACREATILDKPEMAPVPQFQLNQNDLLSNGQNSPATSSKPLICNLRTIIPHASPKRDETGPDTFHHELLPSTMALQKNITASRETKEHKITWSFDDNVVPDSVDAVELENQGRGRATADGDFVRNLKVGDVVTVWAKARFPQWINFVEEVKIDVYWAV